MLAEGVAPVFHQLLHGVRTGALDATGHTLGFLVVEQLRVHADRLWLGLGFLLLIGTSGAAESDKECRTRGQGRGPSCAVHGMLLSRMSFCHNFLFSANLLGRVGHPVKEW